MMSKREVMQAVLDAWDDGSGEMSLYKVMDMLRAELAKPEPEPVAWYWESQGGRREYADKDYGRGFKPLYRKEDV